MALIRILILPVNIQPLVVNTTAKCWKLISKLFDLDQYLQSRINQISLYPHIPRHAVSTSQRHLRTLRFHNVSRITPVKRDLRLCAIETIILLIQSMLESTNRVYRLEDIPRLDASLTMARLENHQKSIKPIDSLVQAATENAGPIDIRLGVGRVEIIQLVRISLQKG